MPLKHLTRSTTFCLGLQVLKVADPVGYTYPEGSGVGLSHVVVRVLWST